MSARRILDTTGDVALELLRLTAATADIFPPLKSAVAGVLHITELVVKFRSNQKSWKELAVYVQGVTAQIIQSLAQTEVPQVALKDKLVKFDTTIKQIVTRIQSEHGRSKLSRFSRFLSDPDMITEMRKEVDDVVGLFELGAIAMTEINVQKTLDEVKLNSRELSGIAIEVATVTSKVSVVTQSAILDKLRYVHGASWDSYRVCLPNTRVNIIDDALTWVHKSNNRNEAQIFLLTAVAGAGKSTIAHTFAQRCAKEGLLVSSFFFDRETAGRNSPAGLFSTIASGLSKVNEQLALRIASAIEGDQDLPYAPISRQFEELVMSPALECTMEGPLVIVIDALDEGWSYDLMSILQNRLPRLSSAFRVFLTSRMRPELEELRQQRHVTSMDLDLTSQSNMEDISLFIPYKLKELARTRGLGDDWPDDHLCRKFETKADGLFLWATTVCEYLRKEPYPTQKLEKLVSGPDKATSSAEAQMDKLYATILYPCDWDNEDFVFEYQRITGAAIATKAPLTVTTLNALFRDEQPMSSYVLQQLSPLLIGTSKEDFNSQPLRVLHQSFRDFLVLRATGSPEYSKFHVAEKYHSQHFALLCLEAMNHDLKEGIIGIEYLANESPGIPPIYDQQISEALWYACRFWIDHLLDVEPSESSAIGAALQQFIDHNAMIWMQLMAAKSHFRGLREVREWCNEYMTSKNTINWSNSAAGHASTCHSLSWRLGSDNRREEALASAEEATELYRQLAAQPFTAFDSSLAESLINLSRRFFGLHRLIEALTTIQEAVELYRRLAADQPTTFNPDLARSLHNLSNCLSDLGRPEEALSVMQESLELRRQLAADRPSAFNSDLAISLNNLSNFLASLGRNEEGLAAIKESVALRRHLAADQPVAFIPDLAESLNNLSNRLSRLGQHEEALRAVQESVSLYRQSASYRPAAFNPNLARSLNNLSVHLSSLGRHEEGLVAIQESIAIRRHLAIDQPVAYNSDLALSLNNISYCFSELGRDEEALTTMQESVELYRHLAKDGPTIFVPKLSQSLERLSECFKRLDRFEEASTAMEQANNLNS